MLKNMDPPLGFGSKCPDRLAYKKLIRMNMPIDNEGKVNFTTTLFALIRENLSIKMRSAEEMDQADVELRETINKLWPLLGKNKIDLLVPGSSSVGKGKLTVGKIYGGLLILDNWKQTKFGTIDKPVSGKGTMFSLMEPPDMRRMMCPREDDDWSDYQQYYGPSNRISLSVLPNRRIGPALNESPSRPRDQRIYLERDHSESEDIYDEMMPWIEPGQPQPDQYRHYRHNHGPGHGMRNNAFFPMTFNEYLTGEPRVCPPVPSQMPPARRPGGRRQLPPTPSHPSSLTLETLESLPTICVTHSPVTPGRREVAPPPENFPRLEPSPSHASWPHSAYPGAGRVRSGSNTSLIIPAPASVPVLGVSPSRGSHKTHPPRYLTNDDDDDWC